MTTRTSSDQPIACTLSGPDLEARTADMRGLAERALVARAPVDGGEQLTFAAGDGVEDALRGLVAAEAACCPFLRLDLDRRAGDLVLTITGPQDARPLIAELFA